MTFKVQYYVGQNFKLLKAFFKWVLIEKQIMCGEFYRTLHAPKEDIPIIVLNPNQLNFLISDTAFKDSLPTRLQRVKDLFVFGCTVGLRYSDLENLTKRNLEKMEDNYYISTFSQKTNVPTRILLPKYAIEIIKRNTTRTTKLLPFPNKVLFNKSLKFLGELAGWIEDKPKYRSRRGKLVEQRKFDGKPYRFCDHISSHTMRRTAVSTLLRLGLDENLVRKISGHAPGSKEFYKYVSFNQSFMDEKLMEIHEKMG